MCTHLGFSHCWSGEGSPGSAKPLQCSACVYYTPLRSHWGGWDLGMIGLCGYMSRRWPCGSPGLVPCSSPSSVQYQWEELPSCWHRKHTQGPHPPLALPSAPLPKPSILCRALSCFLAVVLSASSPKKTKPGKPSSLPLPPASVCGALK